MHAALLTFVMAADAALVISAGLQAARIRRATHYLTGRRDHRVEPQDHDQTTSPMDDPPKMVVLVPMWREQGTVPLAISRFSHLVADRPWARVLFLANDDDGDPSSGLERSTFQILDEALSRGPNNVEVRQGDEVTKADKLRTAMESYEVREADIVAVYDADSSPDGSTLDLAVDRLRGRLKRSVVLQQTSLHLSPSRTTRLADAVGGSALRQTRWSLHFELGRLLSPRLFPSLPQPLRRFRYIIGHGVFLTKPAVELAVPLQGLLIEDSYMSLSLRKAGLPFGPTTIEPLPGTDASELPPSIWGVLDQKARWYTGPRDAFDYYKSMAERIDRRALKLRLLIEAAKLRMHAVYWITGPQLYLLFLPGCLVWFREWQLLGAHASVVLVHAWGIDVVAARATRRLRLPTDPRWPLPHLSVTVWALWGMCALPGFAAFRRRATHQATPLRAERNWERAGIG